MSDLRSMTIGQLKLLLLTQPEYVYEGQKESAQQIAYAVTARHQRSASTAFALYLKHLQTVNRQVTALKEFFTDTSKMGVELLAVVFIGFIEGRIGPSRSKYVKDLLGSCLTSCPLASKDLSTEIASNIAYNSWLQGYTGTQDNLNVRIDETFSRIDALLELSDVYRPAVVAYCLSNSGWGARRRFGVKGVQYADSSKHFRNRKLRFSFKNFMKLVMAEPNKRKWFTDPKFIPWDLEYASLDSVITQWRQDNPRMWSEFLPHFQQIVRNGIMTTMERIRNRLLGYVGSNSLGAVGAAKALDMLSTETGKTAVRMLLREPKELWPLQAPRLTEAEQVVYQRRCLRLVFSRITDNNERRKAIRRMRKTIKLRSDYDV